MNFMVRFVCLVMVAVKGNLENTWDALDKLMPFSLVPLCVFLVAYLTTSFCFWYFLDRHDRRDLKIQKHKQIPKVSDIAMNVCFNLFVVSPLYAACADNLFGFKANWTPLTLYDLCWMFPLAVVVVDVLFYWSHRLCHVKGLYKFVHKRHHELHSPIAFASVYAHWFEHIFVNVTSSFAGQYYIQNSYFSCLWCLIAAFKTCQGHSGYDWSFMGKSWNYHDLHHECPSYNYGSGALMIFDRLFGSLKSREEVDSLVRASAKAKFEKKHEM